jgi:hypothetical protein
MQIGLRVILTMTNMYLEFGGIRWYVDNTLSTGDATELFYTDPAPIAAYQTWVSSLAGLERDCSLCPGLECCGRIRE